MRSCNSEDPCENDKKLKWKVDKFHKPEIDNVTGKTKLPNRVCFYCSKASLSSCM